MDITQDKFDKMLSDHQEYLDSRGFGGCKMVLDGVDMRKIEFNKHVNLKSVEIINSNFKNCVLSQANFDKADLRGSNFSDCDLGVVNFENAKLSFANFSFSILRRANFENAKLSSANFSSSILGRAKFKNAVAKRATFAFADMRLCDFQGIDLSYAIGNMEEIKSMQLDTYSIVYTHDKMWIGCTGHLISHWIKFDKASVMEEFNFSGAAKWMDKWRDTIIKIIEISPATKTESLVDND